MRVTLPLTGDADKRLEKSITQFARKPHGAQRPLLVLEFTSGQGDGRGSDFGRAYGLARFLTGPELNGIKTVAYIPKSVKGHGVLVAMACEEIVMAKDAEIGDAGVDEQFISPAIRSGYSDIADAHRTIPKNLALGMLDKNLQVLKVVTSDNGGGTQYVLESELDELKKTKTIVEQTKLGQPGVYSGEDARTKFAFASYLADNRDELAKRLGLPPTAFKQDFATDRDWVACQVVLDGPINVDHVKRVQRLIDDQISGGEVNFVCLRIDSGGGSPADSMVLASYLAAQDPEKTLIVAYIPKQALADAALIALACDQIVMAPNAQLGGAGEGMAQPDEIQAAAQSFRESVLAKKAELRNSKPRSWSLPIALIDPTLQVYRYTDAGHGLVDYFSDREWRAQENKAWQRDVEITTQNGALQLSGTRAEELGLINAVVNSDEEFREHFGLQDNPALIEPGWAHSLIEALASPVWSMLLLFIGFAAIYAELHAPGVGIGGFIAFVCFMLYFWSNHLHGTAGWLEVLLFICGLGCILLEIFILPGMGIFGLGGGLMVIASLVLASQTFVLPHNNYQLAHMRDSLLVLGGAVVGTVVAASFMRRYLPHTPLFNRMLLAPPSSAESESISSREELVDFRHLLGQHGVTTTQLTPSGKARFGDQLLDVIANGEVIDRGSPVVVIEVRGNRVLVQTDTGRRPDLG